MKLPRKIKKRWLKDLRSGEFGQCVGTLTDGKGGFCCLGVLQHGQSRGMCEIYDTGVPNFKAEISKDWYKEKGIILLDNSTDDPHITKLINMNDGDDGKHMNKRRSFGYIANWIEDNIQTTEGGL